MAVTVSTNTYNNLVGQRDSAAAAVLQAAQQRDQAEANRVALQQQVDDLNAVIATLTAS
jgi:hypothetical protein